MKIRKTEIILAELAYAELNDQQKNLVDKLEQALSTAYAPYSDFPVAATLLLADGTIISGSNQENASYPSGLCAERVALFAKGAQYPNQGIDKLAVTVAHDIHSFPYPCGSCLQVISEFQNRQSEPIEIIMYDRHKKEALIANGIEQLMPFAFIKEHLGKK